MDFFKHFSINLIKYTCTNIFYENKKGANSFVIFCPKYLCGNFFFCITIYDIMLI